MVLASARLRGIHPLIIFKMADVQGECFSNAHWLVPWRQHFNLMMNHGVAAVIRVHFLFVFILCPSAGVRKQKTFKIRRFVICVEDYHKRTQPYTVSNFPTSVVTKTSPACLRPHLHATGTKSNRK